jgi:hypothetical protein
VRRVYLDVHGRPFRLNLRLRHVITTLDVNAHILDAIGTFNPATRWRRGARELHERVGTGHAWNNLVAISPTGCWAPTRRPRAPDEMSDCCTGLDRSAWSGSWPLTNAGGSPPFERSAASAREERASGLQSPAADLSGFYAARLGFCASPRKRTAWQSGSGGDAIRRWTRSRCRTGHQSRPSRKPKAPATALLERREPNRLHEQLPEQLPAFGNLPGQHPTPIAQQSPRHLLRTG